MKSILLLLTGCLFVTIAYGSANNKSPLSAYSAEWDDPKYTACNTARDACYLSDNEKELIYILNLVRANPILFCKTVVPGAAKLVWIDTMTNTYYKSLVEELMEGKTRPALRPDSLCYVGAHCHAVTSSDYGYAGHERQTPECKKLKAPGCAECCAYGNSDPLKIIMALLIDDKIESLGHRHTCLAGYALIGPSIEPHRSNKFSAVLDFHF